MTDTFGEKPGIAELRYIMLSAGLFFITHFFSYLFYRHRETHIQKIGSVMARPYARIIPMHLTLIFGFFGGVLSLFLILKLVADMAMHVIEHHMVRKDPAYE